MTTISDAMELACDLAHNQLVKDYADIYTEDELQSENEPEIYKDEVQDSFNLLYNYFFTEISKIIKIKETKVYVVNSETSSNDKHIPGSSVFNAESFKDFAEEEGTVYSLKGFQESFNNETINTDMDYILID